MPDSQERINIEGLTPNQSVILEGFVEGYAELATTGGRQVSHYDQASAYLRDAFTADKLEQDLGNPRTYYSVMAGLSIATEWMQGLMEQGLSAQDAAEVLRASLATLHPKKEAVPESLDARIIEMLKPEETAILVVDMMDGYAREDMPLLKYLDAAGAPATTRDLDRAANNMEGFLSASREFPIAATMFLRFPEGPEAVQGNVRRKMEIDESPAVAAENGVGWDYYTVQPQDGDIEIVKPDYDAFFGTELDDTLKQLGVKSVIIIGAYTSVCVKETAGGARQHGYNVFVPADLTADIDTPYTSQTPDIIRAKLHEITNVTGYTPLSRSILEAWSTY